MAIRGTNFSGTTDPRKFLVDRAALRSQKAAASGSPEVSRRQLAKKGRNEDMVAYIDAPGITEFEACNFSQRDTVSGAGHRLQLTGPVSFRCCNLFNCELPAGAILLPDEDGVYGNTSRVTKDVVAPRTHPTLDGYEIRTHRYEGRYLPDGSWESASSLFESVERVE